MTCDKCNKTNLQSPDYWMFQTKRPGGASNTAFLCLSCHDLLIKFMKEKVESIVSTAA